MKKQLTTGFFCLKSSPLFRSAQIVLFLAVSSSGWAQATATPTSTWTACPNGRNINWTTAGVATMPTSINAAAYQTINNVLYTASGGTSTGFAAVTNCYAFNGSFWTPFTNGPTTAVYGAVGASVGTTFYLIGGYTGTRAVSWVYSYDTATGTTGTWTPQANLLNKLYMLLKKAPALLWV